MRSVLLVAAWVTCLASCAVTGNGKVVLTFRDQSTLRPVAGMKVHLEWSDERPWRFAIPKTRDGQTDGQGRVQFDHIAGSYWIIRAYRPEHPTGRRDFWFDANSGIGFTCKADDLTKANQIMMRRDDEKSGGQTPGMIVSARSLDSNGAATKASLSVLRENLDKYVRIE